MESKSREIGALTISDIANLKERVLNALLAAEVPKIVAKAVIGESHENSVSEACNIEFPVFLSQVEVRPPKTDEEYREYRIAMMVAFNRLATILSYLETKAIDRSQGQNSEQKG